MSEASVENPPETRPAEEPDGVAGATPATPPPGPGVAPPSAARLRAMLPAGRRQRLLLYGIGGVIALLLLLAAGFSIWKALAVSRLRAEMDAERAQSSSAQKQALTGQARLLLRLTARPLAWSVRAEMLRGNLGQVDDYFREFVRERGVDSIILVGADGRVALATNRKLETQAAEGFVSKALLGASDVAVEETGTTLRMAVPVMGFDRRLGTLVIDYDTAAP